MTESAHRLSDVPSGAARLGFAGLIPFAVFGLAALIAPEPWAVPARATLADYGATILAFMGGCRWGFAAAGLGEGPTMRMLALAVAPSLWAWAALATPDAVACLLIALGLAALLGADLALARGGGAPAWWPALRRPLTIGAAVSLAVGAAGAA